MSSFLSYVTQVMLQLERERTEEWKNKFTLAEAMCNEMQQKLEETEKRVEELEESMNRYTLHKSFRCIMIHCVGEFTVCDGDHTLSSIMCSNLSNYGPTNRSFLIHFSSMETVEDLGSVIVFSRLIYKLAYLTPQ